MMVYLPHDLESSLQAAVQSGHFVSIGEAVAEAVRLLLKERRLENPQPPPVHDDNPPDPLWGLMRDDPELMDEIVADAYPRRREGAW
jgi:Arc/MetJ-type ribon-helix-helix transcriptional regulator